MTKARECSNKLIGLVLLLLIVTGGIIRRLKPLQALKVLCHSTLPKALCMHNKVEGKYCGSHMIHGKIYEYIGYIRLSICSAFGMVEKTLKCK